MTPEGVAQVFSTTALLVGKSKLIDPHRLAPVVASPRTRARTTLKLLFSADIIEEKVIFTEEITEEWNHGAYEELKKKEEILRLRKDKSLNNDRE